MTPEPKGLDPASVPDTTIDVRAEFGIDAKMKVPAFSQPTEHVPDRDPAYRFDRETTLAILAGFAFNRRVMIQGYHGTGKSTHIEQVASRLNWPCIRINLDSHISRIDLIGKDAIVCATASRSRNSAKACCPGRCSIPRRSCSTNMTPAVPM
jgi:cobaltochelatase CobS